MHKISTYRYFAYFLWQKTPCRVSIIKAFLWKSHLSPTRCASPFSRLYSAGKYDMIRTNIERQFYFQEEAQHETREKQGPEREG